MTTCNRVLLAAANEQPRMLPRGPKSRITPQPERSRLRATLHIPNILVVACLSYARSVYVHLVVAAFVLRRVSCRDSQRCSSC
jgi:hypothetical protein